MHPAALQGVCRADVYLGPPRLPTAISPTLPCSPAPQINFEQDTIVSQENEYEILQLMMGDLRDRWGPGASWGALALPGVLWLAGMPLPSGDQHDPSFPPPTACRLQAYASEYDDDVKDLQRRDLTPQQRLAAQVNSTQGGTYQ